VADLQRHRQGLGGRPALVLVDLILGFTDPRSPLGSESDSVVDANRALLAAFRAAELPIFYTTVVYRDAVQAEVFRRRLPDLNILVPDAEWIKVDPRLAPRPGEMVIEKQYASAFFGTGLDTLLRERGVDSLVVTGLTTSGCVRATAVDGLQYDFPVVVVREAVGDRNPRAHEANLHDLDAKYADVLGLAEVLDLLCDTGGVR
jgi:nicotinamidase-related amidase